MSFCHSELFPEKASVKNAWLKYGENACATGIASLSVNDEGREPIGLRNGWLC